MSFVLDLPPYIGSNYWLRLAYTPGMPPRHVHTCPACHERYECGYGCTLEPDLECDDGTPSGAYCCCSKSCAAGQDELIYEALGPILGDPIADTPYYIPPEQMELAF